MFRKPRTRVDAGDAQAYGLGLLPFFPLASGLLTGKYRRNAAMPEGTRLANTQRLADRYLTERNWEIAERLGDFAGRHAATRCWSSRSAGCCAAADPVASVIAGATKPEQLEQNVKAGGLEVHRRGDLAEIDRITQRA